jgi:hypothetical protein
MDFLRGLRVAALLILVAALCGCAASGPKHEEMRDSSGSAAAPAGAYPRQLTGEELVAHFKRTGKVEVTAPNALMSLTFQPGNKFAIVYWTRHNPSGIRQDGTYSVRPEAAQVCFNLAESAMGDSFYAPKSEWMSDCFHMSQTNEKSYSLKTVKGDYSFSYALR